MSRLTNRTPHGLSADNRGFVYYFGGLLNYCSRTERRQGCSYFMGKPLGADFSNYWTSSKLSRPGDPMAVYASSPG